MKKVANTLKSFLTGKFRDSLTARMKANMAEQEEKIRNGLRQIDEINLSGSYSEAQKREMILNVRKTLRKLEDRKAYFYKRIQSLKKIDTIDFESLLKKNPKYDGLYIDEQNRLNLYTKMLRDDGRFIGKFRLCIFEDQSCGLKFRAVNLDWHNRGNDHWAISGFVCCLGEWQMDFERALWSGSINEFFDTFIHYIELSPCDHTYFNESKDDWYDGRVKRTKKQSEEYREKNIERISDEDDDDEDDYEEDDYI